MPRKIDLTGQVFGDLTVVAETKERGADGSIKWFCECDCGDPAIVSSNALRMGITNSCGHRQRMQQISGSIDHGHSAGGLSDIYTTWRNMTQRCTNPTHPDWENYGGRGITVCDRWMIFENFLQDMGEKPEGLLLDRENNERGYEPSNCRWVNSSVSNLNRRPFKIGNK